MWIQVSIVSPPDAGELIGLLDDPACAGGWHEDGTLHLYWPAERWRSQTLEHVKRRVSLLTGEEAPLVRVATLAPRDWHARWARSVRPLRVGRRLVIRPTWEAAALGPDDLELIIDPKQAFGTGHHATTQLLVEWLETVVAGGEHVLDVGTGSGILAMAAVRLGAGSAVGLDLDPVAIDCAREAASVNGFGPELEVRVGALRDRGAGEGRPADLVVANLDRQTLLDGCADLVAWLPPGARLAVSGILEEDRDEVAHAFSRRGLVGGWTGRREGWIALELLAPPSCES